MSFELWSGFDSPINALVLGARDGVGAAIVAHLSEAPVPVSILATSRERDWVRGPEGRSNVRRRSLDITEEESWRRLFEEIATEEQSLNLIMNCTGFLHDKEVSPERRAQDMSMRSMRKTFAVNTFGVGLMLGHALTHIPRRGRALILSLSARVGSIADNRLGGWYSYRASKAAQNMLLKTAAIEVRRKNPAAIVAALHPGTVASDLSAPFTQKRSKKHALFRPTQAAEYLSHVIGGLESRDSGGFFAWDGESIEW